MDTRSKILTILSYQTRFGKQFTETRLPSNRLIERQLSRSTIRDFIPKPLEDGLLEFLVASAVCSPTSGSLQTHSVLALTTDEEKAKLFTTKESCMAIGSVDSHNVQAIKNCSAFLIWIADLNRIDFLLRHLTSDNDLLAQTARAEYHLKAIIDATIVAQSFTMLAESIGLGIMYCGAIRQIRAEHFEKEFNFPKLTFPVFGMAVGYPTEKARRAIRPRLSTDIVLHHGIYKPMSSISKFYKENELHRGTAVDKNQDKYNYTGRMLERLTPSNAKKSVGSSLKNMGFKFD